MLKFKTVCILAAALGSCMLVSACSDDDDNDATEPAPEHDFDRVYKQVERLGNPLVNEVLFAKRDHGFHNSTGPSTDVANFKDDVESFVINVAGRTANGNQVATTLSSVLLPDMLIVQTDKPGSSAGWLTWALADGYGGRQLEDDVVDAALAAVFGGLLNAEQVSAGLTTDNVDANDSSFSSTFPYLAVPH